ncbi:hypothetical protein BH11ACT3_BH11ACT3_04080 [soil metagenome]
MTEVDARPEAAALSGFRGLPRWLRIGIIAAATAGLLLVIAVVVRVIVQTPQIPLGVTAAADLRPGSCLLEPGAAKKYTVVSCGTPHQQQVFARIDLAYPGVEYSADESLAIYADATCARLLEYRLYLTDDLVKADYLADAIAPPTLDQYTSGETFTLCAIYDHPDRPDEGGSSVDLTGDLYRPIPE